MSEDSEVEDTAEIKELVLEHLKLSKKILIGIFLKKNLRLSVC